MQAGLFDIFKLSDGDETGVELLLLIVVIVPLIVGLFGMWILALALLFVLDRMLTVVAIGAAITLRVVLRRPWTVLAYKTINTRPSEVPPHAEIQVVGWRRAPRTRDAIAEALVTGLPFSAVTTAVPL